MNYVAMPSIHITWYRLVAALSLAVRIVPGGLDAPRINHLGPDTAPRDVIIST
jgi:hypothetical protein